MAAAEQQRAAPQHPVMKWIVSASQVLFVSFIGWLGNNISTSVTDFSKKLDTVATSIASISQELVLQKREAAETAGRVTRLEGKVETLEQRTTRLMFTVEQLEKERGNGR